MHVGKLPVPGGHRDVWAFVMVLSYSRALWAELLFDLTAFAVDALYCARLYILVAVRVAGYSTTPRPSS